MKSRFPTTDVTRAALLVLPLAAGCNGSQSVSGPPAADKTAPPTTTVTATANPERLAWGKAMVKNRAPHGGCFKASHPSTTWEEVPCRKPPSTPLVPGRPGAMQVGNGGSADFASSTSGPIIEDVIGSFPTVSGLSLAGAAGGDYVTSGFTLQINTQAQPNTAICNAGPNPSGCTAWQQFVYATDESGPSLFIQYWLIGYSATASYTCPNGGWQYDNGYYVGTTVQHQYDCYWNSPYASPAPAVYGGTDLADLSLGSWSFSSGDGVMLYYDGTVTTFTAEDPPVLGLWTWWRSAEFNVFGPGGGSAAVFNVGTTMAVQQEIDPTTATPTCTGASYTGEINNLNVVPGSCCALGGTSGGIFFTQSNAPGATAYSCP